MAEEEEVQVIEELAQLSSVASDMAGVFVFLPGRNETKAQTPVGLMRNVARKIEPRLSGGKIGLFALQAGSSDYEQVASQIPLPCVLAIVRGQGIGVTAGNITEHSLLRAYATASEPSGCGCGGGRCCG